MDETTQTLLKQAYYDTLNNDYEANQLLEEMQITIREVKESEFYVNMLQQLQNSPHIRNNILRVLGGGSGSGGGGDHQRLQMVIYGLGSIQLNYRSQYQLSLAILLSRDLSHWIKGIIETFDPCMTPLDVKVMRALGCDVLYTNEKGRRRVEDPTLFFMPNTVICVLKNLLEANWCPSRLNKTILFTNIYQGSSEIEFYARTIHKYTLKFDCVTGYQGPRFRRTNWPFFDMSCHFFNLLSHHDVHHLEALLPATKLEKMRMRRDGEEYFQVLDEDACLTNCLGGFRKNIFRTSSDEFERHADCSKELREAWRLWLDILPKMRCPSRPFRINWCPPHTGWIKLNFSAAAAAAAGNYAIVGYGGIFHNEYKECLLSYSGPLQEDVEEEDAAAYDLDYANAEALRKGLKCFMELQSRNKGRRRLVIEGDSFTTVRWANDLAPPPRRLVETFREIHNLIFLIEPLVFHIYKEANSMAIELASERAKLLQQYFSGTRPDRSL